MSMKVSERRAAPRIRAPRSLRVRLSVEAEVIYLSSRGMMLRLPFAPEHGTRHGFGLVVEGDSVELEGIVRNVSLENDEDGTYHVGVEFVDVPAGLEAQLDRFVSQRLRAN